jgi:hypothetical protein
MLRQKIASKGAILPTTRANRAVDLTQGGKLEFD